MKRSTLLVLLSFAVVATTSCSQEPDYIDLVLPNGFSGLIEIVEDPESDEVIEGKNGGSYGLTIPEGGSVAVKSIDAFSEGPFLPVVEYADGVSVEVRPVQDKKFEGVAFWLINQPVDRRMVFFVGTRNQLESFDFDSAGIYRVSEKPYRDVSD